LGNPLWFKRFGVKEEKLISFELRIQKYGYWLAFFSWLPFIGDPMTIALGFFRVPFWKVTFLIVLGKFLRYLVLILPFL
jgi:membrane protein YqaA with SNARE-associated domain